ncbi:MAG: KH domain-containing protein [Acidobacteria bacterium]|nr:KH domain-containing protein [Acidobacteriota bacterium]MCB9398458.1 KH domain-containing protein [Acidobacteriota bacterium]
MQEWLVTYLKAIVGQPDAVEVQCTEGELTTVFHVKVDGEDVGRVKGRQGRMVLALQSVLNLANAKPQRRFVLDIVN